MKRIVLLLCVLLAGCAKRVVVGGEYRWYTEKELAYGRYTESQAEYDMRNQADSIGIPVRLVLPPPLFRYK